MHPLGPPPNTGDTEALAHKLSLCGKEMLPDMQQVTAPHTQCSCVAGTLEWDTRLEGGRDTQGMSQYMAGLGLVPYLVPPCWASTGGADH